MPLIEDKYSDTVGKFKFPITSSRDYEAISFFYKITGGVPYMIEERPEEGCAIHLVRLRSLRSLIPIGVTTAPDYTVEFQTDVFADGITRMVIRDADMRCVVRYERDFSGWSSFAFDKPRLKYFTD